MRLFFKIVGRLFGLILILLLLALAYLHVYGFPPFLMEIVAEQLRQAGVAARFSAIRIDLFRGVIATDARLADANAPTRTLVEIDELQIHFGWKRLWERKNVIDFLRIANAVVAVPLPPDEKGPVYFTARDAFATVIFDEDGTVQIDRLMGEYCGIRLFVHGRFKPKASGETTPPAAKNFIFLSKVVRELNHIRVSTPPELDLDFTLDMARPLACQARLRLRGGKLDYQDLRIDNTAVEIEMHDGAIDIEQFVVDLYGGQVKLEGRYDFAEGRFNLRALSTTDPTAFAVIVPPNVAAVLRDIRVEKNPRFEAHYVLSPETGSLPLLTGRIDTAGLTVRDVAFTKIQLEFSGQGPEIVVSNALIRTAEGQLTGHGRFHVESSDFAYQLDSTIDPTKLLPLMTPNMRKIVEPAWFDRSPHIIASVTGDFVDLDNFGYDAILTTDRCSYRGVMLEAASANLKLRQSQLDARDVFLKRNEGTASGTLQADFNEQRLRFDVVSSANPNEMAPLLGPRAKQVLKPYRFGPRTNGRAQGLIDFHNGTNTAWTATVSNEGLSYWKLTADRASAELNYTNNTFAIKNFLADLYDGQVTGAAGFSLGHETAVYQFGFNVVATDVRQMLNDIRGTEQSVSGLLSGKINLHGQGSDLQQLGGSGDVEIKEGVLIEVPIFGIFSRILDEISPGLGRTKATRAHATFKIANQFVKTDDLKMSAGAFTLSSTGKVGLSGELDLRVKAQMLRQVPLLNIPGLILGKILEYKVGGTIANPSYRPLHLPKEILPHGD